MDKIEPLHLRLAWMDDITQAIAFLESFKLAHGDLRPDNLLLNCNRIKVTDLDNAAMFGTPFTVCQEPWGRELRKNEPHYDLPGCTAGLLGPRTEQFALGSIYYYINYGMEVYGDKKLSARPRDRGLALRDLLQDMQFPDLSRDSMINELIYKCWYNQFPTIASLASSTKLRLYESSSDAEDRSISEEMNVAFVTDEYHTVANSMDVRNRSETEKVLCRKLEEQGLFGFLHSNESADLSLKEVD